jgi:hypothetical protein
MRPAEPLWRLAPTRGDDGRCLADFMMLIPGLSKSGAAARHHIADAIRRVCEDFGESVAFADINYRLNVLWVSVEAEPGLAGRVAAAIRQRVPAAMLVGGQLGAVPALPTATRRWTWWTKVRSLPAPLVARLPGRRAR